MTRGPWPSVVKTEKKAWHHATLVTVQWTMGCSSNSFSGATRASRHMMQQIIQRNVTASSSTKTGWPCKSASFRLERRCGYLCSRAVTGPSEFSSRCAHPQPSICMWFQWPRTRRIVPGEGSYAGCCLAHVWPCAWGRCTLAAVAARAAPAVHRSTPASAGCDRRSRNR